MKKSILCSTDFSPAAVSAATFAAALAAKVGGPLILAHVTDHPEGGSEATDYLESAVRGRLQAEADRLRQTGVGVKELLLRGPIHEVLADLARETAPFVHVAASKTKLGVFERWLVGSVLEKLVQIAPAPTLVVRDATAMQEWLEGKRKLRVFAAVDLSFSSNAPLHWIGELARVAPCEISVGYLNWIPDESQRLGIEGPLEFSSNPPELHALLKRDLREKTKSILGDIPVEVWVEPRWGRADLPAIEMAERNHADLIVVGSRGPGARRFFGESLSRSILHNAPQNLTIVPATPHVTKEMPLTPVRRVLVATDFSDIGNVAIPYAYSLLPLGGFVRLLHVRSRFGEETADLTEKLRALIPTEAEARGIHTEIAVIENRQTAEGICQSAAQFGADVICLSTHGRSGFAQSLMGSVAQEVVARDDRPVLLIPKPT
jgi:nucleotide-binding universal stress UspA family protein